MSKPSRGAVLASTAALLALTLSACATTSPTGNASAGGASGASVAAADKIHCYGVHSCKGNSDCKTAEHACKGQNACGGHGFKAMAASACLDKGGVIADLAVK